MDPKAVTNTTEWRPSTQQGGSTTAHHKNGIATTTAVQFQTTPQSWCKLVARHMKLVDFLGDGGNTENENGNKSGGVFAWAGAQGCGTDRVPFHPLHGAASQGLAGAGRRILEAGCCGNLDQVRETISPIPPDTDKYTRVLGEGRDRPAPPSLLTFYCNTRCGLA